MYKVKDVDNVQRYLNVFKELSRHKIQIGIFGKDDSFIAELAYVHEYGMTIKPKRAKKLAIPISKKSLGKSPSDFKDIFKVGNVMAIKKGKNDIEPLFVLMRQVKIPERSFMRNGFDSNKDKIYKYASQQFEKVMNLEMPVTQFYEKVGAYAAGRIKLYLTDLKNPANAPITLQNKGSDNPLIDTGNLRRHIVWKVI